MIHACVLSTCPTYKQGHQEPKMNKGNKDQRTPKSDPKPVPGCTLAASTK